ncbi:MAG: glycosyl hydrolase family 18 protein [Candidatus Binataceae bacterium]
MQGTKERARIAAAPAVVVIAWLALCCVLPLPAAADSGHWLTGYYATYNYSVMTTSQVDYTKLTHIIYWPVIPNSDGTLNTTPFGLSAATFSAGATDLVTRAHAAGVKALIGIGGDVSSGATAGFEGATTATHQAAFINNIVSLMQHYGFDGVDINWEQITTTDNADFTSFITNLRTRLNTITPLPLLTMPPETKPNGGRPDLLAPIYQKLDQINIQTYVMSGPYPGWETWYNSPLNNGGATFVSVPTEQLPSITNALADYTGLGIPESKLAMGIQFDSAVWQGGAGTSTGGVTQPKQTWTVAPGWSTMPYRQMVALITTAGYTQHFDAVADQSWLSYDPSGAGTMNEANDRFISYDDPTSISHKGLDLSPAQAGVGGGLGGVFLFELSGDFKSTAAAGLQHPLLTAAHGMKLLLPGLVTNLKATAGSGSAKLTWTAASGASGYKVYFENGAGTGPASLAASVSTNQATITGLMAGKVYYFLVEGVDAFGSGVATQVSVTVTLPAPPAALTGLRALPGNHAVLLVWYPSPGATSYSVYTGTGTLLASNLTVTTYTRSSLTNGLAYSFYVVAVNAGGSSKSAIVSATPANVPAAPVLSASASSGQVKLTWTVVAGASSYALFEGTSSGHETPSLNGLTTNTRTVTGLTNGTTYYFYVEAVNSNGSSWPSNERSATPLLPPSVPAGVKATAGNGLITLSWNASTSTTSYNLYKGVAKGGETLAVSTALTSYPFNGLTNGQTYWFYVVAVNADGTSAPSAEVSATPTAATIKPPTGLTASPVSISGSVTLKWTAAAGATASYSYNIYQGSASGAEGTAAVKTVTGNATTATISGLATNKPYYFKVKAVNGGLTSTASNEASANPRVVWVPDFWGGLVQVRIGGGTTTTPITFSLPQCNPNSLAVNGAKLYVVCSAYNANPDKILVYNAATIKAAAAGTLVIAPLQTISSPQFSSLIGIAFDAHNNLWIASNGNGEVLSISAATLNTATPAVTAGLIDSPPAPVGLAFDTDGSLWVTGLYGDGILLNFVSSQLTLGEAAVPRYCISSDNLGAGCQSQASLFEEPEGVALFNGGIWIANNSTGATGTTPGRELIGLKVVAGALTVNSTFGNTLNPASSPFVCPGGLFATSSHLWVNDESYGEATPQCGAAGDVASKTGGIFSFTPEQLAAKTTTVSQVLSYANITGRPGFGGGYVENDQ